MRINSKLMNTQQKSRNS